MKYLLLAFFTLSLLACGSNSEPETNPLAQAQQVDLPPAGSVEPVIVNGVDYSFPRDTTWFALTAERCAFYVLVPPERGDYRARVFDTRGNLIKTVYESGLKGGINEISFNPQALAPGSYEYLLTNNIYADTVQLCRFDMVAVPSLD